MAIQFKKNVVRVNVLDYCHAIFGIQGLGKSTLAYNFCRKMAPDQYVIFNCGKEDGIKALNGAIYLDLPTWGDFEEAVDEICDNRETDETCKNLKIVVIDTIDEVFACCEKEIIRRSNRDGKPCKSINGAYGGYGSGMNKTIELVLDTLWKLKEVGINLFFIGHIREKTMVDPMTDMEYQVLSANLSNKYFSAISTKMDIVGMCYVDRNIVKEKTGRKDINGKAIEKSKITSEARKICFRSDTYAAESKSRFPDIVNEIPLDADAYIEAVENAIKAQIEKSGMSEKEVRKAQEKEDKIRQEQISENIKCKELLSKVKSFMEENKKNPEAKSTLIALTTYIKDKEYEKFSDIKNLADAQALIDIIEEYNNN